MRWEGQAFPVKDSAGVGVDSTHDGAPILVQDFREKTIVIIKGAGSVSIIIQGSIDGSRWIDLNTAATADTVITTNAAVKFMRLKRTSGGLPDTTGGVWFSGFDSRSGEG